jgi:hypothetical protein
MIQMREFLKEKKFNEGSEDLTVRLIHLQYFNHVDVLLSCSVHLKGQKCLHKNANVRLSHIDIRWQNI